jgi:hypothetical protein
VYPLLVEGCGIDSSFTGDLVGDCFLEGLVGVVSSFTGDLVGDWCLEGLVGVVSSFICLVGDCFLVGRVGVVADGAFLAVNRIWISR